MRRQNRVNCWSGRVKRFWPVRRKVRFGRARARVGAPRSGDTPMKNRKTRKERLPVTAWEHYGGAELLLRSEIAFWREMIEACEPGRSAESLERMKQALSLAEYRLMRVYRSAAAAGRTTDGPGRASANDGVSLN